MDLSFPCIHDSVYMPGPRAGRSENGFFRCDTWLQIFQNDSKICEAEVTLTQLINKICKPWTLLVIYTYIYPFLPFFTVFTLFNSCKLVIYILGGGPQVVARMVTWPAKNFTRWSHKLSLLNKQWNPHLYISEYSLCKNKITFVNRKLHKD